MRNEVSDVAFINDLITWVRKQPNVDPDRISIVGVFQWDVGVGARLPSAPEGVNAVVTTGALPTAGCTPEVPPNVLLITSSSDTTVPPAGGDGDLVPGTISGPFPTLDDSVG